MTLLTPKPIEELLELPRDARELLVTRLADSLNDDDEAAVEQALQLEAWRRIEEIESGAVECIPGEEVFRELRAQSG